MGKIQWLEWGEESFEKSRSTGRPILLDIKGSWCHWCHVMDNTSYSDPVIVDLVNKQFIPIRVDTDMRPDVNRRYNMGGWPTTAFLDSEGKVITGGTYIPPLQLREVLRSVLDHYKRNKGRARSKLESIRIPKATGEPLSERIVKDIATSVAVNFDIDYGGFGSEPKFPHTDALEQALVRYHYHGEREMLTVVNKTLEKMGRGGIYDQEEGGFFRYSTTRDWSVPHFEKMAEDNARLLGVYCRAYRLTGNVFFRSMAEGIVRYVNKNLSSAEEGGFYGSQDADEDYYNHGLEERKKLQSPSVDRTLYANYNAMFVSSYFLASVVLGRSELRSFALKTLDKVLTEAVTSKGVVHYWGQGRLADVKGLLTDHAHLVNALLDAYEHTADRRFVEQAVSLADYSLETLLDKEGGGFFDIPEPVSDVGELRVRDKAIDENSVMASALQRLSWITGNESYAKVARKALEVFVGDYERQGMMAASYALAVDLVLYGPISIAIVGGSRAKKFEEFRVQALQTYPARRSTVYLDPSKDGERIKKLGYESSATPVAYVCVGNVCGPPVRDPGKIEESINSLLTVRPLQPQ